MTPADDDDRAAEGREQKPYLPVALTDPLWECQTCGAVVRNMPRHIGWHLAPATPEDQS